MVSLALQWILTNDTCHLLDLFVMVQTCVAFKCGYRFQKGDGVRTHSFPSDPKRRKSWIHACRLTNFDPATDNRLCGRHFKESDYKSSTSSLLKDDAVPSQFNFPKHICSSTPRKPPMDRSTSSSSDDSLSSDSSFLSEPVAKKPKMSPSKEELKQKLKEKNHKIKILNQNIRRKKKENKEYK